MEKTTYTMTYNVILFGTLLLLAIVINDQIDKYEGFSSTHTNIAYTNSLTGGSGSYAKENESILVLTQIPGNIPKPTFKYFIGPIGQFMAIYSTKTINGRESSFYTSILEIKDPRYDIMELLDASNALIQDRKYTIKYYIKVLNNLSYAYEMKKSQDRTKSDSYTGCVEANAQVMGFDAAIEKCQRQ
jgi:hypothetical protein